MYIEDKYWNNYIGDTDDSLTLVSYLADKHKKEISLGEIFSDIGLDQLNGNYRFSEEPLTFTLQNMDAENEEFFAEFYYAIDVITDLAALLLECKINGSVDLYELSGQDLETDITDIRITTTPEEHQQINQALMDFVSDPLAYDLSEMCSEEEMRKTAAVCEALRKELYG